MTTINDQQSQGSVPSIAPTPPPSLADLVKQWEKDGVTLELIIAMIMSNQYGSGAMDVVSDNISGITQQSDILSKVQSDIITLNSVLSKIESQLGTKATITANSWNAFMKAGGKTLLQQFQQTYKELFVGDAANPNGESDIDALKAYEKKFPTLDPIIKGVQAWEQDFSTTKLNGSSTSFETDVVNWDPSKTQLDNPFTNDIAYIAGQHYQANHPSSDESKSTATDYLQSWWTDGNADQQLVSGQSQQDTTQVQSYMQLLQGFDSSAQQDIQLASTQKSQIIQNQKTS